MTEESMWECEKCGKQFPTQHECDKHEKTCKTKNNSSNQITEMKCKCNECKHIWHYLESEEKALRKQQGANAMIGCGTCCSPLGAYYSNKANELGREADKFNKCPKCNSINITKTTKSHDKKE